MDKTRWCCLPRWMYTGKFKKDWWKLIIMVLILPPVIHMIGYAIHFDLEELGIFLGFFATPFVFFYFLITWIIRACGCMGEVEEEASRDDKNEQSEITALIGEIGKQSTITKEKIDIYAAAFLKEDINTRNAFYRCSEQDVESLIKKAGMTIGQKNAMIDIWLAKESSADPEAPSEGDAGLIEVANGQPGIVPASGELEE